jgi:taurine dioxygenase
MPNPRPLKNANLAGRYKHIKPTPRMPGYAAWVDGVDLTRPLSDAVRLELRRALFEFEVLFFRPQVITAAQHKALAEVFGPVSEGSFFERKADAPELEMIECDEQRPPSIDVWHTDMSWKAQPPLGTAIQITVAPPVGGNTCWVSTSKAYAWLSPGLQSYLKTLQAEHTWEVSGFRQALAQHGDEELWGAMQAFKPVVHPVVRTNPDSGKPCIYVNADFTRRIVGLDRDEAHGILKFLLDWLKKPEFMVHHQWEAGGIAVWDNRSTQHYALADYWPQHRVNQRITFDEPGTAKTHEGNVNELILKGKKIRT